MIKLDTKILKPLVPVGILLFVTCIFCFLTCIRAAIISYPTRNVISCHNQVPSSNQLPSISESFQKGIYRYNNDEDLTVPELIVKNGFPVEVHHVITKDGYILELHRIPHGRVQKDTKQEGRKPVVFLQHGLLASSADWIMNTLEKALAYELADQGYDVFMGNARGNTYSRNHTTLSTKSAAFWNFSFHQIALYDIPSMLDHIINVTGEEKIFYIGHSMGTVVFWIMMAQYPEYNSKIRLMSALAPVAYVSHIKSPVRLLAPFATEAELVLRLFGDREFLPHRGFIDIFRKIVCDHERIGEAICENIVFLIAGFDKAQLNETFLPVILGHTPAGTSTHTVIHFAQGINSKEFRPFDYGKTKNRQIYGQDKPPPYNLTSVTAPVALYWSENDWLAAQEDVTHLASLLPNVVSSYKVPFKPFTHLDFTFGIDSDKLVYKEVLEQMKKH